MPDTARLPDHASVVVIGGGVMGCSTLYHLTREGVTDAVLLEKNQLTSGTTWHSAAQVRALRSTRSLTNLAKYSISLYATLEQESAQQTGWINKGSLSIATNPDRLTQVRRQEALAHLFGVTAGNLPTLGDDDGKLYIRDDSGGLLVGCFEPMMLNALHRIPALETAEVKMLLNGLESFTPDGSFLLGETAGTRGPFLGCGMNSMGVATSGGAGMALAHCICHGHSPSDLTEAEPNRFPDCFNSVEALVAARAPEELGHHYDIGYPGHQMKSARTLRRLPLQDKWDQARAHCGQFYGFERPLYFGKAAEPELTFGRPAWFGPVGAEVEQAHSGAAIFDQSSFGKIEVEGPDAERFLNRLCANDMTRPPGRATYTAILNPRGGFEADITVQRIRADLFRIFTGTAAIHRDLGWLHHHMDGERVTLRDSIEDYAVIALMGPDAARIVTALGAGTLTDLDYFHVGEAEIAGAHLRAVRLSYVGEAEWELTCKATNAGRIYDALHEQGARPAGLYAQTSMRIEKAFRAMGHELDSDVTPLEAGPDFAADWNSDFIGRDALLRRRDDSIEPRIATILLDDPQAVPLGNEPAYADGKIVGKTTSAAYGYRIKRPLALAQIDAAMPEGARVAIDIARQMWPDRVTLKPAFDHAGARMCAPTPARMRNPKGPRP